MSETKSLTDRLAEDICGLSLLDAADLLGKLQQRLGISADAIIGDGGGGGGSQPSDRGEEAEKTDYTVLVTGYDDVKKKVAVIKVVRDVVPELGLKEAKDFVESLPKCLCDANQLNKTYKKEEAEVIKKKFEEVGAKVTVQ